MSTENPIPSRPVIQSFGLMTKGELAAELRCSQRHVERLVARRIIPKVILSSRCVRFSRNSVLHALAHRERVAIFE